VRRAARVDKNQPRLMAFWKRLGGSVLYLHMLGEGVPDTLLGMAGDMELVEIKSEDGVYTEDQIEWYRQWRGRPVRTVRTEAELEALADEMKARGKGE
jgi:hypothetical protein